MQCRCFYFLPQLLEIVTNCEIPLLQCCDNSFYTICTDLDVAQVSYSIECVFEVVPSSDQLNLVMRVCCVNTMLWGEYNCFLWYPDRMIGLTEHGFIQQLLCAPDAAYVWVGLHLVHCILCRLNYIFVIGKSTKPYISLPRGKGIKLTVAEERDRRLQLKAKHWANK